jgi:ubiquinone/menaquinone biosynthesis C-methylase UbiE
MRVTLMIGKTDRERYAKKWFEELIWLDSYHIHRRFHKWIIREIPLGAKDRVVDIGCGSGWLSREMARIVTEGEVVGLDISRRFIKKAKRAAEKTNARNRRNLVFRVADAEDIPYPDYYFDCAVSVVSFPFWSDRRKGLGEVKRILKPNAGFYVADEHGGRPRSPGLAVKILNALSPARMALYSPEEYRRYFEEAGFASVCQRNKGGLLLTIGTK